MSEALSAELATAHAEQIQTSRTDVPASPGPASPGRVAELRVSAHVMTLETGLYCVFPTPGSPDQDPASGLPGVRVTPAPGIAGRPEAVSVSTFREDGWLNGTAALVRVTDGSAQILVSVYQDKRQGADAAPRLQVLRLSKEPNGSASDADPIAADPTAVAVPDGATEEPNPEIMAHVQRMGDVGGKIGDWIGVKGSRQWVEGFGLAPANGVSCNDIEYQGVLGRDWLSPWIEGGKYCGSRGMALPLLGLKIRLKGDLAKIYDCSYSATFVDGTTIGPVGAGEPCEADSLAPLEAFQIVIRSRDNKAQKPDGKKPVVTPKPKPVAKSKSAAKPAKSR